MNSNNRHSVPSKQPTRTILVTGGCGFIGSNLIRMLVIEKNCHVINLDKLTYAGNLDSLADLKGHPNYHFEQIDLASPEAMHFEPSVRVGASISATQNSEPEHTSEGSLLAIFQKHRPDAVIHLAAESHVDRSIDGPGEFIQTNVVGTFNLLQASLAYWRSLPEADEDGRLDMEDGKLNGEQGISGPKSDLQSPASSASEYPGEGPISSKILHSSTSDGGHIPYPTKSSFRFLHVSTDEVYGSLASDAPGFSETTAYDPHSPYSASKAASDHLARAWGDTYGLPVLVTNCSNNYGPYQFPEKLIPVVILKCLRGEPIPVYGKGENIRDWLYVTDHAEALYTVLHTGRVGETYNIGGNNERTNLELVKMLCRILDESVGGVRSGRGLPSATTDEFQGKGHKSFEELITFVVDRPGHDLRYAIDSTKIRNELGWVPKENFESGFRKTVNWYLENRSWWERILSGDYQLERLGRSTK